MENSWEKNVYEALGAASMCWNPRPSGIFDSTECENVGFRLISQLENDMSLGALILSKALKDPDYYIAWQANIAMAFKDEWDDNFDLRVINQKMLEDGEKTSVHIIANKAAKRFLDMFLYEPISDGE